MSAPTDPVTAAESPRALAELNAWLATRTAEQRVAWALENTAGEHALSSSFGAQSAVSLHMVARQAPRIPVIVIDTGYLFPETYRFIDELGERLALNLKVYRPQMGAAWMEARFGKLWEQGLEGLERYNRLRKVEPMQRALAELGVRTWIAGLRRSQSGSRAGLEFLQLKDGRWKLHPLADWSDRDVWQYLQTHELPYHPLWHDGYVSIGDVHTTRRLEPGMREEDTRFFGLKRECGLHFDSEPAQENQAA
ncbi:phosphoadenylyl-sulfate reductase [Lysobacter yananisis]|uniref:Phosphoadenosine 5'-phosphosulfate reductase n=2 Tax=Lysobacter TaxID=68 RepID=A0A0S2DDG4_LYSEN|nr:MULTISPECIES: phosphoadenylyl-sulfate reductase [Lysobacter]ALN56590.1 phosphoadenosine phosphosulfate reductase [Lysobacter enzymogenes]QCW25391.1 phosphoadenylyl-sulfate reductase [Lysobacter enzymogenes]UZW59554.1 phosphoadenylyl-sulfate reductase [Lysobacter enzymogenes]WMT03389.1 phosphoadenylyl-sulfate reductase [Lysobacter yananisis]